MTTLDVVPINEIRRTPEALLTHRIAACIATDTDIQKLFKPVDKLVIYPIENPPTMKLPTPSCYIWFSRADPELIAQDVQEWYTLYGTIKFVIKNVTPCKPFELETDGTFAESDRFQKQRLPSDEIYYLKHKLKQILAVDGYENNWYYVFVNNGMQGVKGRSRYDIVNYGGGDTDLELTTHLTCSFEVYIWDHHDVEIAKGNITVTVTDGGVAVEDATVYILDAKGNRVEDSSGVHQWSTNASGEADITGIIAQRETVTYASKAAKSGNTTQDITQGTNAIAVAIT